MNDSPTGRKWSAAIARLEALSHSGDLSAAIPAGVIAQIRRERAEKYAAPEVAPVAQISGEQLIVFRIAAERYALPVSLVSEVLPHARVSPVPGAPAGVAGIIQIRGEILPVYDIRAQLTATESTAGTPPSIVVIAFNNRQKGLIVDEVLEIREAGTEYRKQEGQSSHVAWITDDLVTVLNPDALAIAATDGEPQWKGEI